MSKGSSITYLPHGGENNTPAILCRNTLGNNGIQFGATGKIKVSRGERYAMACNAMGSDGQFGISYSLYDKNGKRIFPYKKGYNLLCTKTGLEWNRYVDSFSIDLPNAAYLKFFVLALF